MGRLLDSNLATAGNHARTLTANAMRLGQIEDAGSANAFAFSAYLPLLTPLPHSRSTGPERISQILELLPAGVVIVGGNGCVEECNRTARRFFGEDLLGRPWRQVVQDKVAPRPDDGCDISLIDGTRVHITTCSLETEPGQAVLISDVTEVRDLERELSQLKHLAEVGEMVASMAHQIRTPLASAMLYVSQLAMDTSAPHAVQTALEQLRHLDRLTSEMLKLAKKDELEVDEFSIAELMTGLFDSVEPTAVSKHLVYTPQPGLEAARILGNEDALRSAILTLVDNAMQMGGESVTVEIDVRTCDGGVEIQVQDDGPGIPPAVRERIFDPFFTTRSNGTGLGLAVVRRIVCKHGGRIEVSDSSRSGASFTLFLPRLSERNRTNKST